MHELECLERGETDTLLVFMPPGSAKSTYVNFAFPAWFMARHPNLNVLTASHSSELAERWGRKTRNIIAAKSDHLGITLSEDSTAAYRWSTMAGGEYYAVGVGVGIAGFRADLGIIDDPFGSREDAESRRIRDSRWAWYVDDFSSRLKPGAKRVIMHTRWHDDDLAGRIMTQLNELGRPYRVLCLPAQAGTDDPLGRYPGEFLWDDPKGYDYGAFLRARKEESDPRSWASLYQQNPVPDEGGYFQRDWLVPVHALPPRDEMRIFGASDYAVTSEGGDYTVHVVVGIDPHGHMYLLDLWRDQTDAAEWIEAFCDLVLKWQPMGWAEETGQIKSAIGPFQRRRMMERNAYVAREQFPTRGDKAVRAQSIRARMSLTGLRIPSVAHWRADLEAELLRFPAGEHDDQVDALSLIGQLLDKVGTGTARPVLEPAVKRQGLAGMTWNDVAPLHDRGGGRIRL
ncbi:phage terminase large subunit [Micromonospora sp. STR1s_5]|nr:phage terminase large subunit [Micromonospora sp. STR1s_5]